MASSVIVELKDTNVSRISKKLITLREQGGAVALGRVLTLVIQTDHKGLEAAIQAANEASREHPCRIVVLAQAGDSQKSAAKLDAEIRVGGDAGASEVIVLKAWGEAASDPEMLVTGLLLPDAPVVAWWPSKAPSQLSVSPVGRIATRRITDSAEQEDPQGFLRSLAKDYAPGDTDFAWTRLTLWRGQLAALLDQPPFGVVTAVEVFGTPDSPSTDLLAAWLEMKLKVDVKILRGPEGNPFPGINGVKLFRDSGNIEIARRIPDVATLIQPTQPIREITLARRNNRDCLSEDLRRLDPDELFGEVLKWFARS